MEMREALLYEKLPGSRVRCHNCQWRCTISPGKLGVCRMRRNSDGVLYDLNYAETSSVAVDPSRRSPCFTSFPEARSSHWAHGDAIFIAGTARTGRYPVPTLPF
jgi:pyruvate formate lyase activating enzyme